MYKLLIDDKVYTTSSGKVLEFDYVEEAEFFAYCLEIDEIHEVSVEPIEETE